MNNKILFLFIFIIIFCEADDCLRGYSKYKTAPCDEKTPDDAYCSARENRICVKHPFFGGIEDICPDGFFAVASDKSFLDDFYVEGTDFCVKSLLIESIGNLLAKFTATNVKNQKKILDNKIKVKKGIMLKTGKAKGEECYGEGFGLVNGELYPFIGLVGVDRVSRIHGELRTVCESSDVKFLNWSRSKPESIGSRIPCGEATNDHTYTEIKGQRYKTFLTNPIRYAFMEGENKKCCAIMATKKRADPNNLVDDYKFSLECAQRVPRTINELCFNNMIKNKANSSAIINIFLLKMVESQSNWIEKIQQRTESIIDNQDDLSTRIKRYICDLTTLSGEICDENILNRLNHVTLNCEKLNYWFQLKENVLRKVMREAQKFNDIVDSLNLIVKTVLDVIASGGPANEAFSKIAKFVSNIITFGITHDIPKLEIKHQLIRVFLTSLKGNSLGSDCHEKGKNLINYLKNMYNNVAEYNHMKTVCNTDEDDIMSIRDFMELISVTTNNKFENEIPTSLPNSKFLNLLEGLPEVYDSMKKIEEKTKEEDDNEVEKKVKRLSNRNELKKLEKNE